MSSYEDESYKKPVNEFSKSLVLTDVSLSRLESKLCLQKGSTTLSLSDCFIGDEGCQVLSKYLKENPIVHNLELRGNAITCSGLDMLSLSLGSKSSLKSLSLEWNNISDNLGVFAEALYRNNSLQFLDLRNNRIGSEGAGFISKILENNTSIQKIDLRWNDLGIIGGRKILSSLQKPHFIKNLELSGNKIPEEILISINQLLKNIETSSIDPEKYQRDDRSSYRSNSPARSERVVPETKYTDELFSKYEAQMIFNARNEARLKELEILYEQESRRVIDLRYELGKDLETEKARRVNSDDNFLRFKEEALKREVENARNIQELDSRLSKALSDKNMLILELESSQGQFENFEKQAQGRIMEMEEKISQQERQYRLLEEANRNNIDLLKKQFEQEKYELLKEFQSKTNVAEDNIKLLKNIKSEQENEIKGLKSQIISIKAINEEATRNLEYSLRQESSQKYEEMAENYEQRLKQLEDIRDQINKKFQDLQKEFICTEKKYSNQVCDLESNITTLCDEKNDINRQLQRALNTIENLRSELNFSRCDNEKLTNENDDLNRNIKECKQNLMQQIEDMILQHTQERQLIESKNNELACLAHELDVDLNRVKRDRDRIIKEHEFLSDNLKLKVSALIQDSVISHMKKIESDS
ncbi:hypothetical protein SteCoe_26106 [Stentor coeruleus]|uniref:Uncharacterized protein n=1 Tax=Stentor coeruleus TaxID=5963 RepID=A0A1R2BDJ3_9CILI|nr:hypothetical protein SteCoe_26106 [Stentor coeruleus]